MREIEPARGHGEAAERAAPFLPLPKRPEKLRIRRGEGLAQSPAGTGQPRRAQAARTVLRNRQATVMRPTPPGTGVM
jgi:hypothetical protein